MVKTPFDAHAAEWLFRLAYDRLQGVSLTVLRARIEGRATGAAERERG
jgi:hypothetical protein